MVQGINANSLGSIARTGEMDNGRIVYAVNDPTGNTVGKVSIPPQQCDVFESSYKNLMDSAPKMQAIAEKYQDPKTMERMRKVSKWSKIIGSGTGLALSAVLTKKMKFGWQALICTVSTIAGLIGGTVAGAKITTPKEALKFTNAMQNLSKVDTKVYSYRD